jgi:hypothetical protein
MSPAEISFPKAYRTAFGAARATAWRSFASGECLVGVARTDQLLAMLDRSARERGHSGARDDPVLGRLHAGDTDGANKLTVNHDWHAAFHGNGARQ